MGTLQGREPVGGGPVAEEVHPLEPRVRAFMEARKYGARWHPVRTFWLYRHEDESGVSGTGVVAVGAQFPTGRCFLEWVRAPFAASWHEDLASVLAVHGHGGKTTVVWHDD